jgi:hypothetical protein
MAISQKFAAVAQLALYEQQTPRASSKVSLTALDRSLHRLF